jgi:transcriptional regulator with GAF, ATPase, and Fis domain
VVTGDVLMVIGQGQIRTVPFVSDTLTIGRSDECDVVVDHPKLSRKHARVTRRQGLAVEDLGSTNGILVGGATRHGGPPTTLREGEAFHIGPFAFVVTHAAAAEPSSRRSGAERLVITDPTEDKVPPLIREIAESGVNVLIQGETGVGKDVLASTIHALSKRNGPFARINCAALSESLLEAELFGYEKGAFTGAVGRKTGLLEAASGGTAFLDEMGELPLSIQAKLLHAIEVREVLRLGATRPVSIDARFVAATNRDLPAEVAAGRFRSDLFFRLDGVTLHIPPLRDRRSMIAPLALRFLSDAAARLGHAKASASPDVLQALETRSWPGNVRELKAVIERALLLARGGEVGVRHLAFAKESGEIAAPAPPAPAPSPAPRVEAAGDLSFLTPEQLEDRANIIAVLEECVGNQTRAAKKLGIARTTLVNKLTLYRIPRPRT